MKSCVGSTWCRYGVQDSVGLAIALELRYRGLRSPHKIKLGVSGCARECAEAHSKDVGVIATENGWNLYVGGNGGFTPRHAELLAADLDTETLVRTIDRFLMFYVRTADRLQRTAAVARGPSRAASTTSARSSWTTRLGICADLDAAMAAHVDGYDDEWAADARRPGQAAPVRARSSTPPTTPDPDLAFVSERGQRRPATARRARTRRRPHRRSRRLEVADEPTDASSPVPAGGRAR